MFDIGVIPSSQGCGGFAMDVASNERIDHFGIVAGMIKDLGLVEFIDKRVGTDSDERITTGEAVAGMIINGLGFTDRPLSLVPQFFEECPVETLFRPGVQAEDFNRFKLGRALDNLHAHNSSALFAEFALHVCQQEGIQTRFAHLDTTSFSLTGDYLPDATEGVVKIVQGHSKDLRPDLKQVVLELIVTPDGGIPLMAKVFDGNASDNNVFKARSKELVDKIRDGTGFEVLYADCKLYSESNAENLKEHPFVTRIPENIKLTQEKITESIAGPQTAWVQYDDGRKYRIFEVDHYGISQRWIVVHSNAAHERAKQQIAKKTAKEREAIDKEIFHLQATRFDCADDARKELTKRVKKWRYHKLETSEVVMHDHFTTKGRPKAGATPDRNTYQITATASVNQVAVEKDKEEGACFVLGTNTLSEKMPAISIIEGYAQQQTVERGFRFLKEPVFFTSSLFVKKASRIEGLLMVMTLALLVYAVAERRLRRALKAAGATIPNQIKKPTATPTLRWVFQLFYGVNRLCMKINGDIKYIWTGITALREKILRCLGEKILSIYQISWE